MNTSIEQPPLHNGHLYTTVTSTKRPPFFFVPLTVHISVQQFYQDHLSTTATATKVRPDCLNNLSTTASLTIIHERCMQNSVFYSKRSTKLNPYRASLVPVSVLLKGAQSWHFVILATCKITSKLKET